MSSSEENSLVRKLLIGFGLSILYGAISISLDPDYADFIEEQDFGDIRPAIFFPALIAILYGPIVGAITAAFGNLIYDVVTEVYLPPSANLDYGNLVGFIGNFIGAATVGNFANPYRNAKEIFELTHEETTNYKKYFDLSFIRRLLRNTLAAMIGLGLVTGLIIGYGQRIRSGFNPEVSFIIFTNIAYWNGLFLIIAIPLIYTAVSILDYYQEKKEERDLELRRIIDIKTPDDYPFSFVRAGSPVGDELWSFQWGAIEFVIKNTDSIPHKYAIRIASNDIFSPHRHTTPELNPDQEDELYFNVNGISSGEKESTIYVKVDDAIKEQEINFEYKMGSSNQLVFNKIMGILLIIATGMSITLVLYNIRDSFVLDQPTILAFIALPVEIILVLSFYFIWNNRATNKLFESVGIRKEKGEFQLMSEIMSEKDSDRYIRMAKRRRIVSTVFLLITLVIFSVISVIVVLEESEEREGVYSNDLIMAIIGVLLFTFLVSDFYLGSANRIEKQIFDQSELASKVIRSAVTTSTPEIYSPTKIFLRVFNPFETKGVRIFFHSTDNITPREFILDEVNAKEVFTVEMYYTPLKDGKRDIGVEVVQFSDEAGQIIPVETAKTFDQEVINLQVSSAKILGLNQSQIGILRGLIAGIGSISLAITFISRILNFPIDRQLVETTLPLLIILQSPVIWLTLSLQDRIKKSLDSQN